MAAGRIGPRPARRAVPEARRLTEAELEELHTAEKSLHEFSRWSSNLAGTIQEASGTIRVDNPDSLSFRVQPVMELVVKVVLPMRPKRLDLFYRVKVSKQVVRMYHSDPGHDDVDGRIDGPHKHRFPEPHFKRTYAVNDIPSPVNQAIAGFLSEERVRVLCPVHKFAAVSRFEVE